MRFVIIAISIIFLGCNTENAPDCLQRAGDLMEVEIGVGAFDRLEINDQFNVILEQGDEQRVVLEYFDNLIPDIEFELEEDLLIFHDNNSCNWVRDYNFPILKITHPNITFIRQNGGGLISSKDTLFYDDLDVISEERSGDFGLTLNCRKFSVVNNDLTNYYIDGKVERLSIFFASGNGRFEGAELISQDAVFFQRGTNDIILQAENSLTGRILGNGNLIFVGTKPTTIDVRVEGRGSLIDRTN